MINSTGKTTAVLGLIVGAAFGWVSRPGPSLSYITSPNPEQAYQLAVLGHIAIYAFGAAIIAAFIGHLIHDSQK